MKPKLIPKLGLLASVVLLAGCPSHISYDFFEPSGAGKTMSNTLGDRDSSRLEYMLFEQGNEKIWFSCSHIGLTNSPYPSIGIVVESKDSSLISPADDIARYLQQSLTLTIGGKTYAPLRVNIMTKWSKHIEAYAIFFESTQPTSQFDLLFKLRNGEERLISFTKKHADYWYVKKPMG